MSDNVLKEIWAQEIATMQAATDSCGDLCAKGRRMILLYNRLSCQQGDYTIGSSA